MLTLINYHQIILVNSNQVVLIMSKWWYLYSFWFCLEKFLNRHKFLNPIQKTLQHKPCKYTSPLERAITPTNRIRSVFFLGWRLHVYRALFRVFLLNFISHNDSARVSFPRKCPVIGRVQYMVSLPYLKMLQRICIKLSTEIFKGLDTFAFTNYVKISYFCHFSL